MRKLTRKPVTYLLAFTMLVGGAVAAQAAWPAASRYICNALFTGSCATPQCEIGILPGFDFVHRCNSVLYLQIISP